MPRRCQDASCIADNQPAKGLDQSVLELTSNRPTPKLAKQDFALPRDHCDRKTIQGSLLCRRGPHCLDGALKSTYRVAWVDRGTRLCDR